jgi:hypothetical protein
MIGAGFAEAEQSSIEALLNEVSIINKARFNYNLELHRFFSNQENQAEIAEFWQSICPFKIDGNLSNCLLEFHRVTNSKVDLYLQIQRLLNHALSHADDIRLIDLYIYIQIVTSNTKSQEDAVLRQYDKDLRAAKLKSSARKKDRDTFKEITIEYPYLNKMSTLLEEHLLNKGKLYDEFFKQVIIGDSIQSFSEYNPRFFYAKKTKKIISLLSKLKCLPEGSEEVNSIFKELCEIEERLTQQFRSGAVCVNSEDPLENTRGRFQHFSTLYAIAEPIQCVEIKINDLLTKDKLTPPSTKSVQPKDKQAEAPAVIASPCLTVECISQISSLGAEALSIAVQKTYQEGPCVSESSIESQHVSLSVISQEMNDLNLSKVENSLFEDAPIISFSRNCDGKKKEHNPEKMQSQSSIPPQRADPILSEIVSRLNKKGQADTLRALFNGPIHKKFSFKELMDLIITCGGKVENLSGSVRRIILGNFASDTLDMPNKEVKLNVHAPHQRHNEKELLPSCIVKHFQCVFMQAGLTPNTLFSEDIAPLRTPKVLKAPKL